MPVYVRNEEKRIADDHDDDIKSLHGQTDEIEAQ